MISFRFHLVSLVAVFLALGLGVLTGTTVLNRGIVAQLERNSDQLAAQNGALRETVDDFTEEAVTWTRFGDEIMGFVIGDRLSGTDVVLVSQEGTDGRGIEAAREALRTAGARIRGEVQVNARMALEDEGDPEVLAELLGADGTRDVEALLVQAADQFADQLAFGIAEADLVAALADQGFLSVDRAESLAADSPAAGPGLAIVVVAGGEGDPALEPVSFLVPLVERLVLDGQMVAASESSTSEYGFVNLLRENDVADRIVTQDNVEQTPGEIGLVLALEDLLVDGVAGHYGVKPGATQLLPAP